jgi:hypothetical protein
VTHTDVRELIAPFALGALEEPEASIVQGHLGECGFCANLAREASEVAHCLGFAIGQRPAPPGSLDRLMAEIGPSRHSEPLHASAPAAAGPAFVAAPPRRRLAWLDRLVRPVLAPLAASLVVVLGLASWNMSLMNDLRSERRDVESLQSRLTQQTHALLMVTSQSAVTRPLEGTAMAPSAQVHLIMDEESNAAMLMASQLPPLPNGYVYQVWLGRQGARMAAGKMWVDQDGNGECNLQLDSSVHSYDSAWITMEPMEGSKPNSPGYARGTL